MHRTKILSPLAAALAVTLLLARPGLATPPESTSEAKATPEPPPYSSLLEYNTMRRDRDIRVMWSLGVWAAGNVISGAVGWPLVEDERWQGFHQMNLSWGAINLAIAVVAGIQARDDEPASHDLSATIERAHSAQRGYLLNVGLDVAYLAAGALMWERGVSGDIPLLEGYGWSLVLQGGVLLVFDTVMYVLDSRDNGFLYGQIRPAQATGATTWEIGYATRF